MDTSPVAFKDSVNVDEIMKNWKHYRSESIRIFIILQ